MKSVRFSKKGSVLNHEDVERNVRIVRYRYNLSGEQASELEKRLNKCSNVNEFVEVLEKKLMEFTVAKGRPSRQEFEDVNNREVSGFSVAT